MEIGGCQDIDLELEADDLIGNFQFPESLDAKKEVNSVGIDVNDRLPELHESTEPERNQRNGRYNLRKSLAWDSAFFTSAGVLDPEELSSMITKTDKKEKRILQGIQEEVTGSTESISTLQSDSLTLESNEDDLFLDIRASIQRSSKKASNFTNSSSKIAAMVLDGSAISSPKKEDFVSQTKCPKPGVKKTSGLQTVQMSKSQLKPIGKLASGRSIRLDSAQSQAGSIGKTGETNSVLPKALKTISSFVPSSNAAKRASIGTGRVKPECGSSKQGSVSGKVTQLPKASTLGGSRKVLPKPVMSSKCSSVRSSTTSTVHSTRSSVSSDNSVNTSSGNAAKPTLMTARRNLGKSSNTNSGPSGSIPKTPSRALPKIPKNKLPASTLSAYLKSATMPSSVSPASSISEWSSVSSTTSSVVNQRSNNLRSSLDASSCRSVDGDNMHSDPRSKLAGQKAERQGIQGAIPPSNTSKKSSTTSGIQAPAKPSGLRLPSPKIGFFDGSSSRTPEGNQRSQSALHPVIPKNVTTASTPTHSSNGKLKRAKVPTARMTTSLANIKSASPKAASPASSQEKSHAFIKASPASSQEESHALVKASSVSIDVSNSSSFSVGVKFSGIGEGYQEAVEVQAESGVEQVVYAGADNLGDLSLNKNMTSGDISTATAEGNYVSGSECISQIGDDLIKNSVPTSQAMKKDNDPANYSEEGLTGDKRGICEKNHEPNCHLLSDTSEFAFSCTAAASEAAACRSLFEPTEPVISVAVAENACFALPSSGSEYFSQNEDGLIADELEKDMIRTSNYQGKEGLTEDKKRIYQKDHEQNCQLLSYTSECALSSTAAASEAAACIFPFEPTEPVAPAAVAENACFALPSSGPEYTSHNEDGLIMDGLKKNMIPISGATEKENDPSNYQGKEGLIEDKKGIYNKNHEQNCQLLSDTSECVLSSIAVVSGAEPCRSQLEPTEPVIQVVAVADDTCFALPSSGSEYISHSGDSLIKDKLKKNLVPTSGALEKENDPTNCQGERLAEDNKGTFQKHHEPNCQLVSDTSECALSSSAADSDAAVHRTPFALKNFSCSKDCVDKSTELVIQVAVAENAGITLPYSEEKENS